MIRTIAIFALFIAYVQAKNTSFTNCGQEGTILWVNVVPCNSDPCTFKPDEIVNINGQLISDVAISSPILRTQVKDSDDSWVDYPNVDTDACKYTDCPIEANVATSFALSLKTFAWPPPMLTQIRFQVYNSDGSNELICGATTIKIKHD
ncbi:mite group 2 allergen Lep d 2 [Tetranychus urticae]|uniref:MD-2-related lipid-recognition domain-containing protein n=1 Tax=Tetranychus urticae TaxID=32264 RepID=T1KLD4_TETUR|nr:mite group 2 allergen Lep d 2 [Tetranychus urticae]